MWVRVYVKQVVMVNVEPLNKKEDAAMKYAEDVIISLSELIFFKRGFLMYSIIIPFQLHFLSAVDRFNYSIFPACARKLHF